MILLAWLGAALAVFPLGMLVNNLFYYRPLPRLAGTTPNQEKISLLIPSRNEEDNIVACLQALGRDPDPELEILVLDDHSTDATATLVEREAQEDSRIRLLRGADLPASWAGKMFACHQLAQAAQGETLIFLDADVRLEPGAARQIATALQQPGTFGRDLGLLSGVPRQRTAGWREGLLVHNILLILLGYLPMRGFSHSQRPSFAAGCGQVMAFTRAAYLRLGGHAAVPGSIHDGLHLARLARAAGYQTVLADLTPSATCQMYPAFPAAWRGFMKNAHEGMASPRQLPIWSVLLLAGHVLPWGLLLAAWWCPSLALPAVVGVLANVVLRGVLVARCGQPWWLVPMHPLAVLVTWVLQITAFVRRRWGLQEQWKGRTLAT